MAEWTQPPELQPIDRHLSELTVLPNGKWPGEQGVCPKHGEYGLTWGFENDHIADMTWRCWPCLLEYVKALRDALTEAEHELVTIDGLFATDKQPADAVHFRLDVSKVQEVISTALRLKSPKASE